MVVRWPWWRRGYRGLALGRVVLVDDDGDPALVCHELAHVAQFESAPFGFWPRYLRELLHVGYRANRFEREARAIERRARAALASRAPGERDQE